MYVTSIALLVPPKARVIIALVTSLFLSGCGGGSSAGSGTLLVTTTATTSLPSLDNLYAGFPDFESARQTAFAIDVNTGQILTFSDARLIQRFLNKQPDPLEAARYPSTDGAAFVAISHLSHQIGQTTRQQTPSERPSSLQFDLINQADPGHFFVFGRGGPAPLQPTNYTMLSSYFCSHCRSLFGTAEGALSFDPARQLAQFEMQNQEISVSLALSLSQAGFAMADQQRPMTLAVDGVDYAITNSAVTGDFFGPEAEQTGLVFSALHDKGVFSAASFGARTP